MNLNIKEIIKDNQVRFEYYRAGNLYYSITVAIEQKPTHFKQYIFPVPISDTGEATFLALDRAIMFMRYIRKAIEEKTFVPFK